MAPPYSLLTSLLIISAVFVGWTSCSDEATDVSWTWRPRVWRIHNEEEQGEEPCVLQPEAGYSEDSRESDCEFERSEIDELRAANLRLNISLIFEHSKANNLQRQFSELDAKYIDAKIELRVLKRDPNTLDGAMRQIQELSDKNSALQFELSTMAFQVKNLNRSSSDLKTHNSRLEQSVEQCMSDKHEANQRLTEERSNAMKLSNQLSALSSERAGLSENVRSLQNQLGTCTGKDYACQASFNSLQASQAGLQTELEKCKRECININIRGQDIKDIWDKVRG